jgi:hypothetical protein
MTTVSSSLPLAPGDMVRAVVTDSDGVDLMADALRPSDAPGSGDRSRLAGPPLSADAILPGRR